MIVPSIFPFLKMNSEGLALLPGCAYGVISVAARLSLAPAQVENLCHLLEGNLVSILRVSEIGMRLLTITVNFTIKKPARLNNPAGGNFKLC
jgi:hypothetical protein